MKRILLDVNVVLDVLLDRPPHAEASAAVWSALENGLAEGLLASHALTTIHHLIQKEKGDPKAKEILSAILRVFGVAAVDQTVLHEALHLPSSEFEDAVTASAARIAHCDWIVTRDPKGFRGSPVRCLTPAAVLPLFAPIPTDR